MWIWEFLFPVKVTGDQNGDGNIVPRNNDTMTNDDEIVTSWQSAALKQATKCPSTERYIFIWALRSIWYQIAVLCCLILSGQINLMIIDNIEDLFFSIAAIYLPVWIVQRGGLCYGQENYAVAIIYSIIQAINDIIW